ncbi:DUF1194 domain-containing protein [uncultured Enterovirga sp.]|uniref:DUF1194 domain-containing protein n=1 Tax=uncultured Enterovirga sp. TaxID=2026352 RepID=UPI0035C99257
MPIWSLGWANAGPVRSAQAGLLALLCLTAAPVAATAAEAGQEVDVALVLAVDVSWSMDPDEQDLQRQGFIEAFRSPAVHDAIRKGMLGRIAVTYFEWASAAHQQVVVPWTVIDGSEGALAFADRLGRAPPGRAYYTSVSAAIDYGIELLARSGVEASRQVIDISGDGPNNDGRLVTTARDAAVGNGIVVNGLPIMLKRPTQSWDIENLDGYYRDCVIGGAGAFLVPVRERAQFVAAIRTKMVREIADAPAPALVRPAQAETRADCSIGEWLRRQRPWN